jgi:hypothetical protein
MPHEFRFDLAWQDSVCRREQWRSHQWKPVLASCAGNLSAHVLTALFKRPCLARIGLLPSGCVAGHAATHAQFLPDLIIEIVVRATP